MQDDDVRMRKETPTSSTCGGPGSGEVTGTGRARGSSTLIHIFSDLCAYQCYAPLPPVRAIVGQGGDLTNLNINCPNIRDIPYNQIPLQKVGGYWGFDTRSVTVQYAETIAVFKMSSEVIKCPTIGAASFGQSPYIARHLPVRGVVGHNIDRRIIHPSNSLHICIHITQVSVCECQNSIVTTFSRHHVVVLVLVVGVYYPCPPQHHNSL